MRLLLPALVLLLTLTGCGPDAPRDGATLPALPPATEPRAARPFAHERRDERERLVAYAVLGEGIDDPHVVRAMRAVPRHRFVPPELSAHAYENRPLPIGHDQTISQPFIVASMTEAVKVAPGMKVLEIGTGSGYQAAILAEITPHVFSIEIKPPLAERAQRTLEANGYGTVKVRQGDGYWGWKEEAPFDAIVVTAAVAHVPPPLVEQLKPGGRMVIPVGQAFAVQELLLVSKDEHGEVSTEALYPVRFVPFTGSLGKQGE